MTLSNAYPMLSLRCDMPRCVTIDTLDWREEPAIVVTVRVTRVIRQKRTYSSWNEGIPFKASTGMFDVILIGAGRCIKLACERALCSVNLSMESLDGFKII